MGLPCAGGGGARVVCRRVLGALGIDRGEESPGCDPKDRREFLLEFIWHESVHAIIA